MPLRQNSIQYFIFNPSIVVVKKYLIDLDSTALFESKTLICKVSALVSLIIVQDVINVKVENFL